MADPLLVDVVDQWGVGDWIALLSAIATFSAVAVSLWQAIVARREARDASDRAARAEDRATRSEQREEARIIAEREREASARIEAERLSRERFARTVSFTPKVLAAFDDGVREHVRVIVRNGGPEPIFDVLVMNSDDQDDVHRSPIIDVVAAHSNDSLETLLKKEDYHVPNGWPRRSKPILYFTDVTGRRWRKSWDGSLAQTAPEVELTERGEAAPRQWWWRYGVDPELG